MDSEELIDEIMALEAGIAQERWRGTKQFEVLEGRGSQKPKSSIVLWRRNSCEF